MSILKKIKLLNESFNNAMNPHKKKNISVVESLSNLIEACTLRRLFIYTIVTNGIGLLYYIGKNNIDTYNMSYSRFMSRCTGKIMNITVPTFLRKYVYGFYIKFYNVNKDEIKEQNLSTYRSLKDFFIREIDV